VFISITTTKAIATPTTVTAVTATTPPGVSTVAAQPTHLPAVSPSLPHCTPPPSGRYHGNQLHRTVSDTNSKWNTVRSFSTHRQQSAAQGSSTNVSRSGIRLIFNIWTPRLFGPEVALNRLFPWILLPHTVAL
jgi:hypothetical protein